MVELWGDNTGLEDDQTNGLVHGRQAPGPSHDLVSARQRVTYRYPRVVDGRGSMIRMVGKDCSVSGKGIV